MKIDQCYANAKNQAARRTSEYEEARPSAGNRERHERASPGSRLLDASADVDVWYWAVVVVGFAGFAVLLFMGY